jgi:hypothetical protein
MMMAKNPHESYQKEPIALLWIIIGLLAALGCMIGIERLVVRY